jgi:uracil-DNA glycosylase family 4
MEFAENKKCAECPLHETAKNPGIGTRAHALKDGNERAVLFVGEAPGYNEDKEGTCWIGQTGTMLQRFVDSTRLVELADVFFSNACRCRPPQNANPTNGQVGKCRPYLQADLDALYQRYREVVIVCCGKYGALSVTKNTALKPCFSWQGYEVDSFAGLKTPEGCTPARVFFTYHPAILLPQRKPALVKSVQEHFSLLIRYLKGEFIPNNLRVKVEVGCPVPDEFPDLVCVDIETYGILEGVDQSVFHPMKSLHVDKVPIGEQIVTVAVGYKDPESVTGYRTILYEWDKHKYHIRKWFRMFNKRGTTVLGQNIKFDLQYLRANDSVLSLYISPQKLKVDDTLIASFLYYEQRPEKGLKELATLFGITDYSRLEVTGSSGRAKNSSDPKLHYYNCLDVATTLALYEFTWEQIGKKYGKDSYKFTDTCKEIRNQVLWDVIMLEANGAAYDVKKLRALHKELEERCKGYIDFCKEKGVIIASTGSEASKRDFLQGVLTEAGIINDYRVAYTDKKKELSYGKENVQLALDNCPKDSEAYPILEAMHEYAKDSKVMTSYTNKLLNNRSRGIVTGNIAYSMWYPIPSRDGKKESKEGGTIQARFAATNPPSQTYPKEVKKCVTSRFANGVVAGYDLSQIELRMGALLSGDPTMIREYNEGIDRHTVSALLIQPEADPDAPDFRSPHGPRQLGKQLNFLVLYKGGAAKYQETCMKECQVYVPLDKCEEGIARFDNRYGHFRNWQEEVYRFARSHGYYVLPTGWSRTFGTGKCAETYINEIANFPIQTISAQLLHSAQFAIQCEFIKRGLKAKVIWQIHDALYVDMPVVEEAIVDEIVFKHMRRPPLMERLEYVLRRTVPIEVEKEAA